MIGLHGLFGPDWDRARHDVVSELRALRPFAGNPLWETWWSEVGEPVPIAPARLAWHDGRRGHEGVLSLKKFERALECDPAAFGYDTWGASFEYGYTCAYASWPRSAHRLRSGDLQVVLHDPLNVTGQISVALGEIVFRVLCRWVALEPVQLYASNNASPYGGAASDPYAFADDTVAVIGYSWMVGIHPQLVSVLGGVERVLRDAPVIRAEAVSSGIGEYVVLQFSKDRHSFTDTQLRAWKEFLSPVLEPRCARYRDEHDLTPWLLPEDRINESPVARAATGRPAAPAEEG